MPAYKFHDSALPGDFVTPQSRHLNNDTQSIFLHNVWLLNVTSHELEYFEAEFPAYVTLSHRWGKHELTFQDVQIKGTIESSTPEKAAAFCDLVQRETSIRYVWVDTCCIDKTNSSELSESINSMYKWYSNAERCYVYLADVSGLSKSAFIQSEWFMRGWTLQELLASPSVQFYNKDWEYLGNSESLRSEIVQASGLPVRALQHHDTKECFDPTAYSVAERMSWASRRSTHRIEDRAYSLMGLFKVNMPLLYGEGKRAFQRLQEEILRQCDDPTLLAWQDTSHPDFGIMAGDPSSFTHSDPSEEWVRLPNSTYDDHARPEDRSQGHVRGTTVTAAGITIKLILIPYSPNIYLVPLYYRKKAENEDQSRQEIMCIALRPSGRPRDFSRVLLDGKHLLSIECDLSVPGNAQTRTVLLERRLGEAVEMKDKLGHGHQFKVSTINTGSITTNEEVFICQSDDNLVLPGHADKIGVNMVIRLSMRDGTVTYVIFGHNFDYLPFCLAIRSSPHWMSGPESTRRQDVFYFPTIRQECFRVTCSEDVMSLVMSLQDKDLRSLSQHSLEFHLASQADQDEVHFFAHNSFRVHLKPDQSRNFEVLIQDCENAQCLGARMPGEVPSFESRWSQQPWIRDVPVHDHGTAWKNGVWTFIRRALDLISG